MDLLIRSFEMTAESVLKIVKNYHHSSLTVFNHLPDTLDVLHRLKDLAVDSPVHITVEKQGPWILDCSTISTTYVKLTINPIYFKSGYSLILPNVYWNRLVKRLISYLENTFNNITFSGLEL